MKTDAQLRRQARRARSGSQTSCLQVQAPAKALEEQLRQRFERLAKLDTRRIAIEVRDGAVTLTGEIQSLQERDIATRTAWSVPGVTGVQNLLTIA